MSNPLLNTVRPWARTIAEWCIDRDDISAFGILVEWPGIFVKIRGLSGDWAGCHFVREDLEREGFDEARMRIYLERILAPLAAEMDRKWRDKFNARRLPG